MGNKDSRVFSIIKASGLIPAPPLTVEQLMVLVEQYRRTLELLDTLNQKEWVVLRDDVSVAYDRRRWYTF